MFLTFNSHYKLHKCLYPVKACYWHSHPQSAVQASPDLKHLHLLVQSFLHGHFVNSWLLAAIVARVVQQILHVSPSFTHP